MKMIERLRGQGRPQKALMALGLVALCLMPEVAAAAAAGTDLFSKGKDDISATMFGPTVKYIMWGGAAISGLLVGIFQKNWVMGAVTFFGAMIFWNVAVKLIA
ncbi:hypothetical protein AB4427_17600 [Vibrio artabrorum]|uniref:hypothetical protein n=1 Tax=Vibrio artabrorum TaxID=446374 RepID=UPI0035505C48